MDNALDPNQPLVLLIGTLDQEGILSTLKTAGRQFKIKRLDSSPENWKSIVEYFDKFKVRCVLIKLNGYIYTLLTSPDYAEAREALLERIARVRHAIFVYEDLLSNSPDIEIPVKQLTDDEYIELAIHHHPKSEVRRFVNDLLASRGLNILPYRRNAELTVMASSMIREAEEGLLFRLYVPDGRIWANEIDRLLQLFRDYLARVGHVSVRLDQHRTGHGSVYEFFGTSQSQPESPKEETSLALHFKDFSHLLDLCVSDPDEAESLLRSKQVDPREISAILARYAKEAKRLQVDLKHEREQKILSIRQRLESELTDIMPSSVSFEAIAHLVDAAVPALPNVGSVLVGEQQFLKMTATAGGNITFNFKPQIIEAVNSVVAHQIEGDIHLTDIDKQLLQLVRDHAGEKEPELTSAVRELADDSAPQAGRLLAKQKLKAFLFNLGAKLGDLGLGVLQTYIEKKLGLS